MLYFVLNGKTTYTVVYMCGGLMSFIVKREVAQIVTSFCFSVYIFKCVEGSVLPFHSQRTTISEH